VSAKRPGSVFVAEAAFQQQLRKAITKLDRDLNQGLQHMDARQVEMQTGMHFWCFRVATQVLYHELFGHEII